MAGKPQMPEPEIAHHCGRSHLAGSSWRGTLVGVVLIAFAALLAYHNSLSGPFVFDDVPSIPENTSIRRLWPIGPVLNPPHETGVTVSGRPLVNLSFAVNHAFGGTAVKGYHLVNLTLHVLAAIALFGVVRRTLRQPALFRRFGNDGLLVAAAVAIVWTVHPLQTAAVTYLVQRAEVLVGLFYLLTLYAFIRATEPGAKRTWFGVAVVSCWLGMASKEVMVTAPVVVLLYDWVFVSGSLRRAWVQHRWLHGTLAASWLLLAWLMAGTGGRGGTIGFGTNLLWWEYALMQVHAIPRYLGLALWPRPLVFDYGVGLDVGGPRLAVSAFVLLLAVSATLLAWARRPILGFTALCFFVILAPTSSVVPVVSQVMAEHRMYLPLASVVAMVVIALYAGFGRRSLIAVAGLAVVLSLVTIRRNEDYRSELRLWADTVAHMPENARARYNLGLMLAAEGRQAEAMAEYEAVLRLEPNDADARNKLGSLLLQQGRPAEAIVQFDAALQIAPDYGDAHNNLAIALIQSGRGDEAIRHFAESARLKPRSSEAQFNLGNALVQANRWEEAKVQYERVLQLQPDHGPAKEMLARLSALER